MTETADLGSFRFESGDELPLTVAYETYGDPDDPAVLVCHALTGSQHVAPGVEDGDGNGDGNEDAGRGPDRDDADSADQTDADTADQTDADTAGQADAWWKEVVGPGRPVDTNRFFVVCANVPGSCYGTTGPASPDPETGDPYGSDFPTVTVGDWTRAQARLLDHLGVDRLHAAVGGSVGGMNVLEWARRYPDRVDRVVPVATAARLGSQALALNATARRAITGDPNWQGGDYYGDGPHPDHGLAQARRIGHVMYLSGTSMDRRFGRKPAADRDPDWAPEAGVDPTHDREDFEYRDVVSYLDYNADAFTDRFDANSYLRLLRAMDEYDLAAGHADDAAALGEFDGEALIVSFTGDWHFSVERSRDLARAFRAAGVETTHEVLDSAYGHDAFLTEPETFARSLAAFLRGKDPATAASTARGAPVHTSLFR